MLKKLKLDDSIIDQEYKELIFEVANRMPDHILAGGTLRRLLEGQPYTGADFDFYCPKHDINLVENIRNNFGEYELFQTSNASSFLIKNFLGRCIVIQCVTMFSPKNLLELFKNFDIRCCMVAFLNDEIYYEEGAVEDIKNKIIRLGDQKEGVKSGFNTIKRIMKLYSDGYNIDSADLRDLMRNITKNKIPLFGSFPSEDNSSVNDLLAKSQKAIF